MTKYEKRISIETVRTLINYNPDTGSFSWKKIRRGIRPKQPAGSVRNNGYLLLTINRQRLLAHRIAIALCTGAWPSGVVDHIDGDPTNNRLSNLRDVTIRDNVQNAHTPDARNASGIRGVSYHARDGLWRARIYANGRNYVKYFKHIEDARMCYESMQKSLHPGFVVEPPGNL